MTAVEKAQKQCAYLDKDKETVNLYKKYINCKVKLWGIDDENKIVFGTYIAKHVDIGMHYILIDGEESPKPFNIFNIEFIN